MESRELSTRNRISDWLARSELEAMKETLVTLQVIDSEARVAERGQRNHMLQEHQVLLQAGEREDNSETADALGVAVTRR